MKGIRNFVAKVSGVYVTKVYDVNTLIAHNINQLVSSILAIAMPQSALDNWGTLSVS